MNWTDLENAIHAWVVAAAGLAADKVVWADQRVPQRPPFVTLKHVALVPVGVDQLQQTTDLEAPPGQEITFTAKGIRRMTVSIQAFTAAVTGSGSARELVGKVLTAMALPSVYEPLELAGLVWRNQGSITDLSALLETEWQSRAAMTVEFYCVDSAAEKTTYIETAVVTEST